MSELSEKSKTPAIRFKGFSGDWGENTMLNFSSRIGDGLHGTPKYTDDTGIYFINGNNLVSGSIFITDETKQVDKEEQSKVDISLDTHTILISINGTIGNLAWYRNESIMLGKSIAYISLENCAPSCVYFYLQTKRVNEYFTNNLTGSTIKNLGLKAIREAKIIIPKNKKEQTQTGNFFQQLDRLIAQHQQKHDKLLSVKKALLEKMFPKQGETQPAIRFKGFSEAWEEIQFSNFTTRQTILNDAAELPRIEYEDIISGKGILNKNIHEKICAKSGIKFKVGDVLFGKLRPYLKNWLLPSFQGLAVGDFWVLRANQGSGKFIYYLIQTESYENVANQSTGTKMPRSDWSVVSKSRFNIPEPKEQTKIGTLFQQLDSLIKQQQSQITKLGNIKQAMLAKMFV